MNRLLPILMVLIGLALAVGSMASAAQAYEAPSLESELTLTAFDRDAAMPILSAHAPRPIALFSCARVAPEEGMPTKRCQVDPVFSTAPEATRRWPPSEPLAFVSTMSEAPSIVSLQPRPPKAR